MSIKNILFLLLTFFLLACQPNRQSGLTIVSEKIIDQLPSASGISYQNGKIWAVGDDANSVFVLNMDYDILEKYTISQLNNLVNGRIEKAIKADFESLAVIDQDVYILGSGSKEISRDTLVIFNMVDKKVEGKYNMRPLYQELLKIGGFDSSMQINIEGLVISEKEVYLLQRGNICGRNDIYQMSRTDFIAYLQTDSLPKIELFRFELPEIDSYKSGFSGACLSSDQQNIIFTSSVEATNDVYHDGEVLGSFIGMIPITGSGAMKDMQSWPLLKDGLHYKTKIESVSVIAQDDHCIQLLCASDNDNGKSGFYRINLKLNTHSHD